MQGIVRFLLTDQPVQHRAVAAQVDVVGNVFHQPAFLVVANQHRDRIEFHGPAEKDRPLPEIGVIDAGNGVGQVQPARAVDDQTDGSGCSVAHEVNDGLSEVGVIQAAAGDEEAAGRRLRGQCHGMVPGA